MASSRIETGVVDVTMPQMGVSVTEGTVVLWRKRIGDRIEAEETICEITTDKIDTELPAPVAGVVSEILVPVDATVEVGVVLARIATGGEARAPAAAPATTLRDVPGSAAAPATTLRDVPGSAAAPAATLRDVPGSAARRYSPVVRRIAAAHDVDLERVIGTGRGGRVRKQDLLGLLESPDAQPERPLHIESPYRPEPAAPWPAAGGTGQLSRARRQIGEHMKRSLETAAHCTTWIEVDMGRIETARARLGLTALPFVARAAIAALREHPALNASLEGERYTRRDEVNLGIAVSLGEEGLIVPVVKHAHELSVEGLASRIKDLARRARARGLTPDDVREGTFTITNPGQYGTIMATPIINQPQVAILDLEAVVKRAVVLSDAEGYDSIAIRPMTILGLSWDHRALDGALAAQFLASVKRHLEGWTGA